MIFLIADANELFSAIIAKGRGRQTKKLEIIFSDEVKLFAPSIILEELNKPKNKNDLISKSGFSEIELEKFLKIVDLRIEKIPDEKIFEKLSEAESVSPHAKDTLYFAAAIIKNFPIWSGEKRLKEQTQVPVFNTKELVEKFGL